MEFRFFGIPQIVQEDGESLSLSAKTASLLAYLWLHQDGPHSREKLAGLFWPEVEDRKALRNLRHAIYELRQTLEPTDASRATFLIVETETVQFRPAAPCRVDVEMFQDNVRRAERRSPQEMVRCLEDAVALYRGDALEGCDQPWCDEWRLELRDQYQRALERLVQAHAEMRQFDQALSHARRCLAINPYREFPHRQLMVLFYARGERAKAVDQYRQCRQMFRDELNLAPTSELQWLRRQIEADRAEVSHLMERLGWSSPTCPHNLPHRRASFVGREAELKALWGELDAARLLTLTGAPGCGKTRLALELAHRCLEMDRFGGGVWWVDLASIAKPAHVPWAVAAAMGINDDGWDVAEALAAKLDANPTLLVLDNCEHLVGACAELTDALLSACSGLTLLATSREPLGLAGERRWPVLPLATPSSAQECSLAALRAYDAVAFLEARARSVCPDFALTRGDAVTVAELCRRLDGIPLALELAVTHLEAMPMDEIVRQLDDRFRLLDDGPGSRASHRRHQTLQAALDWSYELLGERERALLRRLSVFAGGFTMEAAQAVCASHDVPEADVPTLLSGLVRKSFVVLQGQQEGESRYALLDTVQGYGLRRLEDTESEGEWRRRHLDYYLCIAEQAERRLSGPDQARWLRCLSVEHANLRSALRTSLEGLKEPETGGRLASALWRFWKIQGHWIEGESWLRQALRHSAGHLKAILLQGSGNLAWMRGELETARSDLEASLRLCRAYRDGQRTAHVLVDLGIVAFLMGDIERARSLLRESLHLHRALNDSWGMAVARLNIGIALQAQGKWAQARTHYEASRYIFNDIGERRGLAHALINLGNLSLDQGDAPWARERLAAGLDHFQALEDPAGLIRTFLYGGKLAWLQGRTKRAAQLFAMAEGLQQAHGAAPESLLAPCQRAEFSGHIEGVRKQVGDAPFQQIRALSSDSLLSEALREEITTSLNQPATVSS